MGSTLLPLDEHGHYYVDVGFVVYLADYAGAGGGGHL